MQSVVAPAAENRSRLYDSGAPFPAPQDPAPPPLGPRAVRIVFIGLGLVALALVIAYWSWRWWGPEPLPRVPGPLDSNWAVRIVGAHLFGNSDAGPAGTAAAPAGNGRLLGTFSESGGRGYALFRLPSGPKLIAVGGRLPDGSVLTAVRGDSITTRDGAAQREVSLRVRAPAADNPAVRVAAAGASACAPSQGFKGSIYRLNAELLGGMATAPDTWKALLQPAAGALVVRDQSGFGAMLGLQNGDRLERANGIVLTAPEDVVAAVLRPLSRSLPVELVGRRDGVVRQWLYLNAGSCPG